MNERLVKERIVRAVDRMVRRDAHLLAHNCWEAAITHRVAVYLEGCFPKLNVDCEYDRDEHNKKILRLEDLTDAEVRPDIIVHRRGDNEHNLVVIEAKKMRRGNRYPERDFRKLRAFRDWLGYEVIVFLALRSERDRVGALLAFEGDGGVVRFADAPDPPPDAWYLPVV